MQIPATPDKSHTSSPQRSVRASNGSDRACALELVCSVVNASSDIVDTTHHTVNNDHPKITDTAIIATNPWAVKHRAVKFIFRPRFFPVTGASLGHRPHILTLSKVHTICVIAEGPHSRTVCKEQSYNTYPKNLMVVRHAHTKRLLRWRSRRQRRTQACKSRLRQGNDPFHCCLLLPGLLTSKALVAKDPGCLTQRQ